MQKHFDRKKCRMLCIQGTGKGKSLLYQTLAAHFVGVTVYISPLLTLSADQVGKLMARTHVLGSTIIPINLDAVSSNESMDNVIKLINNVKECMSVVVFSSPQTLTNKFKGFIRSVKNKISFVVVDELHMFNYFGSTFRKEFGDLQRRLFKAVSAFTPMLFLTASCNSRIKRSFEAMIGVAITDIEWPDSLEIVNRRVSLYCQYSQKPMGKLTSQISSLLLSDEPEAGQDKVIVYSNIRKRLLVVQEKLEDAFDNEERLHQYEILSIHGQLTKEEKSAYIQMFLNPVREEDKGIKVMCATSGVGNVGVDSPHIRAVFRMDCPPSILDFVQECGRAGRVQFQQPLKYSYNVWFSLESFLYLYERAMDPNNTNIDPTFSKDEVDGLFEVGRLLVLQDRCFYLAIENHLGNPSIVIDNTRQTPCRICPFCRNRDGNGNETPIVPPMHQAGTRQVIFHVFNPPPSNANVHREQKVWTVDVLVDAIRSFPNATELILQSRMKGGISPDQIKRILFCMLLKGMMQLNFHTVENRAVFSLTHSTNNVGEFALMEEHGWRGLRLK